MQGKLVFNQSLSTFLSLYRFSKMAFPSVLVEREALFDKAGSGRERPLLMLFAHLLRVKSALVSPATVTGFDPFLAPSCQATTV